MPCITQQLAILKRLQQSQNKLPDWSQTARKRFPFSKPPNLKGNHSCIDEVLKSKQTLDLYSESLQRWCDRFIMYNALWWGYFVIKSKFLLQLAKFVWNHPINWAFSANLKLQNPKLSQNVFRLQSQLKQVTKKATSLFYLFYLKRATSYSEICIEPNLKFWI